MTPSNTPHPKNMAKRMASNAAGEKLELTESIKMTHTTTEGRMLHLMPYVAI